MVRASSSISVISVIGMPPRCIPESTSICRLTVTSAAVAASDACLAAVSLSQLTVIFTPPAAMAAMRRHFCGPSTG